MVELKLKFKSMKIVEKQYSDTNNTISYSQSVSALCFHQFQQNIYITEYFETAAKTTYTITYLKSTTSKHNEPFFHLKVL